MDTTEKPEKSSAQQGMRLLKSFVSTTPFAPGRRPFFKYRDLGLEAATGGRMRAYQNNSIAGMTEATGWHYHVCEMQFVYVLKGWVLFEYEGVGEVMMKAGSCFYQPPNIRHRELKHSKNLEMIEVVGPASFKTFSSRFKSTSAKTARRTRR